MNQTVCRYTVAQRRELKAWFDTLDRDGSGEIGVREMAQPLLATGIAMSACEVAQLVRLADKVRFS
jgi:Ca2+-binding EF-hand superfamily protein